MMDQAQYLTGMTYDHPFIYGACYDESARLVLSSLRGSSHAGLRPRDPAYLSREEIATATKLDGKYLYLGHAYDQYGHFLLETLPMLSTFINQADEYDGAIMLPWGSCKGRLISKVLEILGKESIFSQIRLHGKKHALKCSLEVANRPVSINSRIEHIQPYKDITSELVTSANSQATGKNIIERVFLQRKAKRVDSDIMNQVETWFKLAGFVLIRPEQLTLADQLWIISNAKIIAGFGGSQLHGSVFAKASALVVEIGDAKRRKLNPNQLLCAQISGSKLILVGYSDNIEVLTSRLEMLNFSDL
jgi:capsular polysaccharide biosynthesis protein